MSLWKLTDHTEIYEMDGAVDTAGELLTKYKIDMPRYATETRNNIPERKKDDKGYIIDEWDYSNIKIRNKETSCVGPVIKIGDVIKLNKLHFGFVSGPDTNSEDNYVCLVLTLPKLLVRKVKQWSDYYDKVIQYEEKIGMSVDVFIKPPKMEGYIKSVLVDKKFGGKDDIHTDMWGNAQHMSIANAEYVYFIQRGNPTIARNKASKAKRRSYKLKNGGYVMKYRCGLRF